MIESSSQSKVPNHKRLVPASSQAAGLPGPQDLPPDASKKIRARSGLRSSMAGKRPGSAWVPTCAGPAGDSETSSVRKDFSSVGIRANQGGG